MLTISLGQMDVKLGNPAENWRTVQQMTAEASRRGSDLVVFPELWSTGYDLENAANYATTTDKGLFAQVAALAQKYQIAILGSCLSLLGEDQFGNTAVYFDKNGRSLGEYSKLHLFRLMQEEQFLTAGGTPTLVAAEWGKAGLTICYDLRFPELFRQYALAGAQLVFVPAEWPHPRLAHWRTLLRARAIETQCWVIAPGQWGRHDAEGKRQSYGHSLVIDPWGCVTADKGEGVGLAFAEIDLSRVAAVRQQIPVACHRRLG